MTRLPLTLASALALSFATLTGAKAQTAAPIIAIHAGHLVDTAKGVVLADQTIVIEGDRIVAVGPSASTIPPANARLIDLSHSTVLPGLIDVHTHLTANPEDGGANSLTISTPDETIAGVVNAKKTLMAGFTAIRNVGAGGFTDVAVRNAVNAGAIPGPRMQVSGPPLGATGGHADENLLPWEARHGDDGGPSGIADSPWGFRAKVRQNAKYGVDVIKFMASGGVLSHGDSVGGQQLTQEEMDAIVSEAHRWGRKVAVHAHGTEAIKAALRAGADSIEHASLIDDEGIKLAKAKGAYLDMDVYDDDYILAEGAKKRRGARLHGQGAAGGTPAARKLPQGVESGGQNGLRHRRGRLSARDQRQTVHHHGDLGHDADGGDPVRHHLRRQPDGMGRPHRPHSARLLRGHHRGGRRPDEGCLHAGTRRLRDEGR